MHCETSDRVIKSCALDVTYSQGVRGRILLGDDSIKRHSIPGVHLGVIKFEIECARWTHGLIAIFRLRSFDRTEEIKQCLLFTCDVAEYRRFISDQTDVT